MRLCGVLTKTSWTRGIEFGDANGSRTVREEACKYCLAGALQAVGMGSYWSLRHVANWIRDNYPISEIARTDDIATIVEFNDDIAEWKDIQRLLSYLAPQGQGGR